MTNFKDKFHQKPLGIKILIVIGFVILGVAGAAAFALLFGYLVMHLWNWLMPDIFNLGTINFWQAVGITILARIIFGGFKHGGSHSKKDYQCKPSKKEKRIPEHHKWEFYDDFWQEEGKDAFDLYVEKKNNPEEDKTA